MSTKPNIPVKVTGSSLNASELNTIVDFFATKPDPAEVTPAAHVGSGGTAHANAVAGGAAGFMTGADKTKLDGAAPIASPTFTGTVTAPTIVSTTIIRLKGYTVATLPVGVEGDRAYVTDATAPTYLGALTGGGTVKCPVFYNGTAWVSA